MKELFYLLGYFYADAHLSKQGGVRLEIIESDSVVIEYCLNKTGISYSSGVRQRKNSKNKQKWFYLKSHKEIFNKIMNKKDSMKEAIKYIDQSFLPYFIRGFFDGDGCINKHNNKYYRLYFYSSFDNDWSILFSILDKLDICYTHQKIIRKNGKHKSSLLCISKNLDLIKFFNYVYPEKRYDFGLLRKFDKLNSIEVLINQNKRSKSSINTIKIFT